MELDFRLVFHANRTATAWTERAVLYSIGGEREIYTVRREGSRRVYVTCADRPPPRVLEFLRAHIDWFYDAGFPMDTWILISCPGCGADSFEPCHHKARPGKYNRYIHRERVGLAAK